MKIIVDSDGLIGLVNRYDVHHLISTELLKKLKEQESEFIYPASMIAEATAILQIRLNKQDSANLVLESVKSGELNIEPIDHSILVTAISYLHPSGSKHATLFDGIVAAVAEKYRAEAIFSFDKFYKRKGFKLASEL